MTKRMTAETEARMRPLWAEADRALRSDPQMLADLAEMARDAVAERARRASRSPEQIEAERARARHKANERYANDPAFRDAALARSKARHEAKRANSVPDLDQMLAAGALD